MLHLYLSTTAIFMLTALLNLLTACFHPSRGPATQDFLLLLILILSICLMQELTSIFTLSSLTLVNSRTLFLCLFCHLPMTKTLSKEECQDTPNVNWICTPCFFSSTILFTRSGDIRDFFLRIFVFP